MPRYRPPKITRNEAAAELQAAYDEGYAAGIAGRSDWLYSWNGMRESEWTLLKYQRRAEGCRRGYAEFTRRVRVVVSTARVAANNRWAPAPAAPPTSDGGR